MKEILELDFGNTFNTADCNRILVLKIVHIKEVAKLLRWLYHMAAEFLTSSGDEVTNASGVQQGCPLASLAFELIIMSS